MKFSNAPTFHLYVKFSCRRTAQINLNLTLAIVLVAQRSKRELGGGGNLKIDDEVFFRGK